MITYKQSEAWPLPPQKPDMSGKAVKFIGLRTREWLNNKVDADWGELYFCTDDNTFNLAMEGNMWLSWDGKPPVNPQPEPSPDPEPDPEPNPESNVDSNTEQLEENTLDESEANLENTTESEENN